MNTSRHNQNSEGYRNQSLTRSLTRTGILLSAKLNQGPMKRVTRPVIGSAKFMIGWSVLYMAGIHQMIEYQND
jgi:hypothetical protein